MVPRVVHLAVLVGLVVVVSAAAADERSSTLPPPGIHSNAAWLTVTTGPTNPAQQPPQIFAITARSNPDALMPFDLFNGLKKLDATAALIWAQTISKSGHPFTFKRAAWPPRLIDFRVDHGWEGQPLVRIQQRLLWIAVGAWNLDVRVYFGAQHPSKPLLAAVQAELNRLTLPAS